MKSNADGTAPPARTRASAGKSQITTYAVVATLVVLSLSVGMAPVFAQTEWELMNITAEVTGIERVHGTWVDEWSFSVLVTNNEARPMEILLRTPIHIDPSTYAIEDATLCFPGHLEPELVHPGHSTTLQVCGIILSDIRPIGIMIDGNTDVRDISGWGRHVLAFNKHTCSTVPDEVTCAVQSVDHLIRDVEPEPVQCEAPAPTSTMTGGMPNVGSAAYNTILNDIVVSFDGPVELAEGWRDHMTIRAETADGPVDVDGLHRLTTNVMSPGSMMWLALAFSDYQEFQDVAQITLLMGPGTILYGDGRTNVGELVVGLELIP